MYSSPTGAAVLLGAVIFVLTSLFGVSEASCFTGCHCFRTTLRCVNLHLEALPPHIVVNTTVLDLRFNKIKRIKPGELNELSHLGTFMINDNYLTRLENGVFKGLTSLKFLSLHRNRIHVIEERAFDGMPRLEQLYLHYNKIESLPVHLFDKLQNLERIFLQENKIQRIEPGTFSSILPLKRLRLDGNALICDCNLMWLKRLSEEKSMYFAARCAEPHDLRGRELKEMVSDCKEPRILEHPHDVVVSFGGPAEFTCRVEGDPMPQVVWMHNSNEIDSNDPKYELKSDGSLVIVETDKEDLGVYECMAMSPYGQTKSKSAKIVETQTIVPKNRWWVRKPEEQTAVEGETIQLECEVDGAVRVSWFRDDIPLEEGPRRKVSPEGTLTVSNVSREDTGHYKCLVETPLSRLHAFANVTINSRPRLRYPPENMRILAGRTAELRCDAIGHPEPIITWYHNGETVLLSDRIQFEDQGEVLRILETTDADSGLYVCVAQNVEGQVEASAELRVRGLGPPVLLVTPFPVIASMRTSVELPCKAEGQPTPTLTWFKNERLLELDQNHIISSVGSLRIFNVNAEDAGLYKCVASNVHGNISAEAVLRIGTSGVNIEDNLVLKALEEARVSVDRAVNSTIEKLFFNRSPKNPNALMKLFRYPDPEIRQFVRAADVFEKTLTNIKQHITAGLQLNETEDFSYEDVLTTEQLKLIARLSGCMEHQVTANCSDLFFHLKYRTIDGTCNNLQHPYWGASLTAFRRLLKPVYENGFSTPVGWSNQAIYYGFPKPGARIVSTTIISTEEVTEDDTISHMVMQWGQFLDHDIDHAIPSTSAESWEGLDCKKTCEYSPPCFPMEVPRGDPRINNRRCMDFIRSSAICGSGMTSVFFDKIHPREQINQLTAYIDGSQIYGYTVNRSRLLRDYSTDEGLLRVGLEMTPGKHLLPQAGAQEVDCRRDPAESDIGCFLAGDIRANEQVGLLAMHTIWLREHNRVAKALAEINPHWPGETLFNEARKVLGAVMQHITYEHWLPIILGPKGMEMLGTYEGYKPNVEPAIANVFATAALRFGHTLIQPVLRRLNKNFQSIPEGDLALGDAFFSPWRLVDEGGVDPVMRGLFASPAKLKRPKQGLNSQLTERLFEPGHAVALDLAAMNIQRARDHGLPPYIDYRARCGLSSVHSFDDLAQDISDDDVRDKLQQLYGHPGNIDVWIGGVLEDPVEGAKVGPTFLCLLIEQFKRIRDGDRFWYENPATFKPGQLTEIKQATLARVICDNSDNLTRITRDVFTIPGKQNFEIINCDELPSVDLRHWYDCQGCNNMEEMAGRERRDLEVEAMEERVGSLEGMLMELKRTVKNLQRRVRKLVPKCRDARGRPRKDGEIWPRDKCTSCECQGTTVTCTKLKCPELDCEEKILNPGKCCQQCAENTV